MAATEQNAIIFPLRSNSSSLLAGAPAEAVRRRLKFASLLYEDVFLEAGVLVALAGPKGVSTYWLDDTMDDFQTPQQRGRAKNKPFVVGYHVVDKQPIGPRPPARVETMSEVEWSASFFPFVKEFTAECNWLEFLFANPDSEYEMDLPTDPMTGHLATDVPLAAIEGLALRNATHDLNLVRRRRPSHEHGFPAPKGSCDPRFQRRRSR